MVWEEKRDQWEKIVSEAYRSGQPIKHWCAEHGIRSNNFYRWAKKLGYTVNKKRSEKYYSLMEGQARYVPSPPVPVEQPLFVEVLPRQLGIIEAAAGALSEDRALISIRAGSYEIGIRDGFNEQTLSKVLEVVGHA